MKTIQKLNPKIVHSRDYTRFSMTITGKKNLLQDLSLENMSNNSTDLEKFIQICINTLDQMTPRKKKYVRGNNVLFKIKKYLEHTKINRT